jgi:hypothetical protein
MGIEYSALSFAPDGQITPHDPERRAVPRLQTVLRVGRVVAAHDEGLVRVTNISDQGAHLRIRLCVLAGEFLTLELAEDVRLAGRVVWTSGDECGVQFDRPIDCGALLSRLAASAAQGLARPVRLPVAALAVIRSENGLRLAKVSDVSQRGMKLSHDGSFTQGLNIKITLASGLERLGVVRWSKDNVAGIMLLQPLSADDLGSARSL